MDVEPNGFRSAIFSLAMRMENGEQERSTHALGLGDTSMSDLEALSLSDLKKLQRDVAKAITTFEDRQKAEAKAKLEAFAKDLGYPLTELISSDAKALRPSSPPKYRHPENPNVTWTGRGRKPAWFVEALAAGKTEADMAIA